MTPRLRPGTAPLPRARPLRTTIALTGVTLILSLGPPSLAAQASRPRQPDLAAATFAAAWATSDLERLQSLFADELRFTIDGRTRTGVRPEQAVAALRRLLEDFEGPTPLVVRAEPNESGGESGFAELRWEAWFRDIGTPRPHTFIATFARVGDAWRITDLRILD